MAWDPYEQPCDYVRIADRKSPGLADVFGAADGREFSVRQPPFTTGALILYKRRSLAEFSVTFRLHTPDQFAEWAEFRKPLDQKPNVRRRPKALDIWHPLLEELDIKAAVVKKVHQGEQTTEDGEWTYRVDFLESRGQPKMSLVKMEGSKASPKDAVERRILDNDREIERLAQELAS